MSPSMASHRCKSKRRSGLRPPPRGQSRTPPGPSTRRVSVGPTIKASTPFPEVKAKEEPAESDVGSVIGVRTTRWADMSEAAPAAVMLDREGLGQHGEGFITSDMNKHVEDDESAVFARVARVLVGAACANDLSVDAPPPAAELVVKRELMEGATAAEGKMMAMLQSQAEDQEVDCSAYLAATQQLPDLVASAAVKGSRVVTPDELQQLGDAGRSAIGDCRFVEFVVCAKRRPGAPDVPTAMYNVEWSCHAFIQSMDCLACVHTASHGRPCWRNKPGTSGLAPLAWLPGGCGTGGEGHRRWPTGSRRWHRAQTRGAQHVGRCLCFLGRRGHLGATVPSIPRVTHTQPDATIDVGSSVSVISGFTVARSTLRTSPFASDMPPPPRPMAKRKDDPRETGRVGPVYASPSGTSIAGSGAASTQDAEITARTLAVRQRTRRDRRIPTSRRPDDSHSVWATRENGRWEPRMRKSSGLSRRRL